MGVLCLPGEGLLIGIPLDLEVAERDGALGASNIGPNLGGHVYSDCRLDAVKARRGWVAACGCDGTLGKLIGRLGLGADDTLAITLILRVWVVVGRILGAWVGSIFTIHVLNTHIRIVCGCGCRCVGHGNRNITSLGVPCVPRTKAARKETKEV